MYPELSHSEILRYSRHLLIPEVGLEGQRKLKSASILVIGTGGLGSPVALYLAAAGIGRIGLIDYDVVDFSNLQRQVIHGTSGLGTLKVESARKRMLDLNPDIQVDVYNEPFTSENAMRIAQDYDILIDGTDNFPTRYLVNDVCVFLGKANVYGSIFRFDGQVSVFDIIGLGLLFNLAAKVKVLIHEFLLWQKQGDTKLWLESIRNYNPEIRWRLMPPNHSQ